ncbi:MAG: hypothetical protein R3F11_07395 [Verrucomicrobiales bacterium]
MSRYRIDRAVGVALAGSAALCGGLVLLIVWFLWREAWPAVEAGRLPHLFRDETWRPGSARDPQYGILPMLAASLLVTLLAAGIAAPAGIAGAVFHRFYLPAGLAAWNRRALELLAGVPSVVFGFWGLAVLVPAINRWHPPGQSLLAAGLVLALMILPTVALTAQAALRAVPEGHCSPPPGWGWGARARS